MSKDDDDETEVRFFNRSYFVWRAPKALAGPFKTSREAREWMLSQRAPVDSVAPR